MDALAEVCERIANRSSRLRKIALLADYLRTLDDADLGRAVHFLCCGPIPNAPPVTLFGTEQAPALSIGGATLREAAMAATGWDRDMVRTCTQEVGDTGETIGLLMHGRTAGEPLRLEQAARLYSKLQDARQTAAKVHILIETFKTHRPPAVKYFVKIISGNLRIGLHAKMVEEAVAAATGARLDEVRAANNRMGNLAAVALAARHGELRAIEAALFHPMEFMLAKPLEDASEVPDPANWIIEDKYDGIRSQVHYSDGRVEIYSRGMDEVTTAFPELEEAFRRLRGSGVLDGEILAWQDGRALAFTVLQQRIARKRAPRELVQTVPVAFIAYDLLFRNGAMFVDQPVEERRFHLEQILDGAGQRLIASPQYAASNTADINQLFEDARLRGNEGLLLKRRGSLYESGKRSGAWYKLKRPYATLDVVITAAEQGTGKRATVLSDYTFAVRSEAGFVNVGKAYSGLTDPEVRELTRILRAAAAEKFGRVVLVQPSVVLEVAFDGIQKSPRHKSGFALRFPRIVRWRRDKTPADCDHLDRVRALYDSSLNLTK